jgi:RNA polymerase sigma factor (TIGR02999 family)
LFPRGRSGDTARPFRERTALGKYQNGIDLQTLQGYLFGHSPRCAVVKTSQPSSKPVTELLVRWRAGDQQALETLVPLVYKELRNIARYHLQHERPGHTLQSAALVNETYLRLVGQKPFEVEGRVHFLAVASRLMRQILVDYARSHTAAKRGPEVKVDFDAALVICQERSAELVALDEALEQLSHIDEQQGRIVELRFFGGLSIQEIGDVLGISRSTVKREWNIAKAWLSRRVNRGSHGKPSAMAKS